MHPLYSDAFSKKLVEKPGPKCILFLSICFKNVISILKISFALPYCVKKINKVHFSLYYRDFENFENNNSLNNKVSLGFNSKHLRIKK